MSDEKTAGAPDAGEGRPQYGPPGGPGGSTAPPPPPAPPPGDAEAGPPGGTTQPPPSAGSAAPPGAAAPAGTDAPPGAAAPAGTDAPSWFAGASPPPRPAGATVRLFRRSSDDKIIAGVCGGLGRATNVDPIVYRVLAVVLTFFGGAGVLLYALGWLLLPEDRTNVSLTERALGRGSGRGRDRTGAVALTAVLVLAAGLAVAGVVNDWAATVLVLLVAGGIFLLLRRDGGPAAAGAAGGPGGRPAGAAGGPAGRAPSYGTPVTEPGAAPTAWYAAPSGSAEAPTAWYAAPSGSAEAPTAWYAAPSGSAEAPTAAGPTGPSAAGTGAPGGPGAPAAPSYGDFATPPSPPRPPRTPGVLGPLTFSVLLISLGILAAVDASGANVAAAAYPALALLVIGLGLLVGTWFGRSRWLIALGLLAALALPPTIAADVFHPTRWKEGRDQVVDVTDVGAISGRYDFAPGRAELDLTGATFTERTIRTQVDMPGGELRVRVPANVDVTATVDIGAGDARLFGRHSSGLGVSERVEDLGADGRGGGVLELQIDQGLGSVEVQREAA